MTDAAVSVSAAGSHDAAPSAPSRALQAVTDRHYRWVSHSWSPDAAAFKGLGRHYVENPEFRGTYDDAELPGCPEFIAEAMAVYADRSL